MSFVAVSLQPIDGARIQAGSVCYLVDFGNNVESNAKNGFNFFDELDMDQYGAPKQHTPSSGLHYIFNVDGKHTKRIGSKTCITHNGIK